MANDRHVFAGIWSFYGEVIIYNQKEFLFPLVMGHEFKWQRQRKDVNTEGRDILLKWFIFLNCWYSRIKLAWCINAKNIMLRGNHRKKVKIKMILLVCNFMLLTELKLDKLQWQREVSCLFAGQNWLFFFAFHPLLFVWNKNLNELISFLWKSCKVISAVWATVINEVRDNGSEWMNKR